MKQKPVIRLSKTTTNLVTAGLTFALLTSTAFLSMVTNPAAASSHREAPLISRDPSADDTDTYAFVSRDNPDTVTIIGSWIPGELPQGGPNFYSFADDVVYYLYVDNDGDANPNVTYKFEFSSQVRNPETFLYNVGPISSLDDPNWNIPQTYKMTEIINGHETVYEGLKVAPVNIGTKSTPKYEKLWESSIASLQTDDGKMKVFAGPTDDPFWVDLGSVFDLLTLRGNPPPVGYQKGRKTPTDGLKKFNVHSIAVQVPISRLLRGAPEGETVIGVWATSDRSSMPVLGGDKIVNGGDLVQVSRLGMPLVNEVVIPLALKDAFNSITPHDDFDIFTSDTPAGALLRKSILTPELQFLLNGLYGVPYPSGDRTDIVEVFLTGMVTDKPFTIHTKNGDVELPAGFNVNQPKGVDGKGPRPAEMIRLNTAIKGDLCADPPNYALGLLGGDACGFPNGRRLQDDVTDIELVAVAGAAFDVLTPNDQGFQFNPDLAGVLNDHVNMNDKPFRHSFPYLATPHQGQEWFAGGGGDDRMPGAEIAPAEAESDE